MSVAEPERPRRLGLSLAWSVDRVAPEEAWSLVASAGFDSLWLRGGAQAWPDPARTPVDHGSLEPMPTDVELSILVSPDSEKMAGAQLRSALRRAACFSGLRLAIGPGWSTCDRTPLHQEALGLASQLAWFTRALRPVPEPASRRCHQPRVLVGGLTREALVLAATHGDGWGSVAAPEILAARAAELRRLCDRLGRDSSQLERVALLPVHVTHSKVEAERLRRHAAPTRGLLALPEGRPLAIGTPEQVCDISQSYLRLDLSHLIYEPTVPIGRPHGPADPIEQAALLSEVVRVLRP